MIDYERITEIAERISYYKKQLEYLNAIERQVNRDGKGIHISVEHEMTIPEYDDSEYMFPMMMGAPQPQLPEPYNSLDYFHILIDDIECLEYIHAIRIITTVTINRLKRQLELITKEQ